MSTVVGSRAEAVVAEFVEQHGMQVLDRNWRTRYCEVDIVGYKGNCVYFIEVKYRSGAKQGTGLDYITPQKLQRMRFAAELWVGKHQWRGSYELLAAEVGPNFKLTKIVVV